MLMGVGKCVGVCTCSQLARRFVLRDMGNGVDRIEMPELIPLEDAKEEAGLHGPHRTANANLYAHCRCLRYGASYGV